MAIRGELTIPYRFGFNPVSKIFMNQNKHYTLRVQKVPETSPESSRTNRKVMYSLYTVMRVVLGG